jgi:hypothetical protein
MPKECVITTDFEGEPSLVKFVERKQSTIKLFTPSASFPRLSGRVTLVRPFYENERIIPIALSSIHSGWKILKGIEQHYATVDVRLRFFQKGEIDVAYLSVKFPGHYVQLVTVLWEVIEKFGEFVPPAYAKWETHIPIAKGVGLIQTLKDIPPDTEYANGKYISFVVSDKKPKLECRQEGWERWEEVKF